MRDHEPTVRSRELGLALSRAAAAKGLNGTQLAMRLGWSASKVSRLMTGKRGSTNTEDIAGFLAICGIHSPRRETLLNLARNAYEPSWWHEYGDRIPERLTTLSDYEDAAIAITNFANTLVPGLLQTQDYMRAQMRALPAITDEEIEERVLLRLARQNLFDRTYPARYRFFLEEAMLTRKGPGRQIMSDQVHHLLRMAVRPYVEIRIVPDDVGLHAGQLPLHLMEFTELHPVVFIENPNSAAFLEQKDTIAEYRRIVADLDRVALDEEQSRAWLATVATALGQPREEHDEHAPNGVAEEFVFE